LIIVGADACAELTAGGRIGRPAGGTAGFPGDPDHGFGTTWPAGGAAAAGGVPCGKALVAGPLPGAPKSLPGNGGKARPLGNGWPNVGRPGDCAGAIDACGGTSLLAAGPPLGAPGSLPGKGGSACPPGSGWPKGDRAGGWAPFPCVSMRAARLASDGGSGAPSAATP